ncbi:hypothetical protein GGS24DRAFT_409003 [Hypoxylon argillaceum]|nr:hypothetical protein GGS24DRAFT_409003 [Hypoxylon argillaceum]
MYISTADIHMYIHYVHVYRQNPCRSLLVTSLSAPGLATKQVTSPRLVSLSCYGHVSSPCFPLLLYVPTYIAYCPPVSSPGLCYSEPIHAMPVLGGPQSLPALLHCCSHPIQSMTNPPPLVPVASSLVHSSAFVRAGSCTFIRPCSHSVSHPSHPSHPFPTALLFIESLASRPVSSFTCHCLYLIPSHRHSLLPFSPLRHPTTVQPCFGFDNHLSQNERLKLDSLASQPANLNP